MTREYESDRVRSGFADRQFSGANTQTAMTANTATVTKHETAIPQEAPPAEPIPLHSGNRSMILGGAPVVETKPASDLSQLQAPHPLEPPAPASEASILGDISSGPTLYTDGPTPKEWTARGFLLENYPPRGYAAKDDDGKLI